MRKKAPRGVEVARVARGVELRHELPGAHDRPGHEVGEERQVGRELPEADGREVPAVHVDDVADRHEGEEGDPDREDDRAHVDRDVDSRRREQVVRRGDEEAVVLEVAEQSDVARDGRQRGAACARARPSARWMASANCWFHDRRGREQEDEAPVPGAVEDVAGGDDERPPALAPRHQEPREREHDQEEDRERGGREEHRSRLPTPSRGHTFATACAIAAARARYPATLTCTPSGASRAVRPAPVVMLDPVWQGQVSLAM